MALPDIQRAHVTKLLSNFCEERVPLAVRDQVRMDFRVRGHDVELFESRPAFRAPHDWQDVDVAKFRYVKSRGAWKLYCKFRDGRWRAYQPRPEATTFEELLREVDADPTCIFWG